MSTTYNYTYDSKGNITKITKGSSTTTYTYDDLGQLTKEQSGRITRNYTYDNAGNITSIQIVELSGGGDQVLYAARPGLPTITTTTTPLSYTNSEWGDLLTSYDGHAITYDEIGNPLSYYNGSAYTFTWEGRRLVGAVKGSNTMSFTYNDEGIRTSKTVNGVTHTYQLNGSQIVSEKWEDKLLVYLYDASCSPIGMMFRKTSYALDQWDVYWFAKNLQGDILSVYNSNGQQVATYSYNDAWGNHSAYILDSSEEGARYNPFRYRGYYYDTDLEMYYLQSRYYDAKICRFINADGYVSTGQGLTGYNMFAYCNNNPVMLIDYNGTVAMPFGELLWPGEIHREVQEYLRDNYGYVLEVSVQGKRIDLVKDGNAYEIKPFTVPKSIAILQLLNYVMLSGGDYVIGENSPELTGSFISQRGFIVNFYYMGSGVIQYSFSKKTSPSLLPVPVPERDENRTTVGSAMVVPAVASVGAYITFVFGGGGKVISPFKEMDMLNALTY